MSDLRGIARKFSQLDFHDDALTSITIRPIDKRRNSVAIDFEFRDDATRAAKVLSFRRCANVRFAMDFDVMAGNWFAQTEGAECALDVSKMRKFVRSQRRHWRVKYMPPIGSDKPVRKKLASLRKYVLFKLKFFGGTAEILAQRFTLT